MRTPIKCLLSLATLSVALFISHAMFAAKPAPISVRISPEARATLTSFLAKNPGATAHAIEATGSMKPTLDENWVVVMSLQNFWDLRPGDIVAYRASDDNEVLHRVTSRVLYSGVRVQGDAMQHEDNTLVRERDYISTAIAAIHRVSGALKTLNKRIADDRERLAANPPTANR